jgi:hypothetical protein
MVGRGAVAGAGLHAPDASIRAYQAFDLNDWAWEFLRRHGDYQSDWRGTAPRTLRCVQLRDGTTLLRPRRRYPCAERWGLYAFADPSRPARKAPVFWLPSMSRRIARAKCQMVSDARPPSHIWLAGLRADRSAVIGVDGLPVLSMKGPGFTVGLIASGWHVLTRPAIVTVELEAFEGFSNRIECLEILRRLTQPTMSASFGRLPIHASQRLHQALTALDGSLHGLSYREIAIMIFGQRRVAEDWNGASRSLKDRTRRVVAKGHQLMNGGYRDLLR